MFDDTKIRLKCLEIAAEKTRWEIDSILYDAKRLTDFVNDVPELCDVVAEDKCDVEDDDGDFGGELEEELPKSTCGCKKSYPVKGRIKSKLEKLKEKLTESQKIKEIKGRPGFCSPKVSIKEYDTCESPKVTIQEQDVAGVPDYIHEFYHGLAKSAMEDSEAQIDQEIMECLKSAEVPPPERNMANPDIQMVALPSMTPNKIVKAYTSDGAPSEQDLATLLVKTGTFNGTLPTRNFADAPLHIKVAPVGDTEKLKSLSKICNRGLKYQPKKVDGYTIDRGEVFEHSFPAGVTKVLDLNPEESKNVPDVSFKEFVDMDQPFADFNKGTFDKISESYRQREENERTILSKTSKPV